MIWGADMAKPRLDHLHVLIEPDLREAIETAAKRADRTVSQETRRTLRLKYMRDKGGNKDGSEGSGA